MAIKIINPIISKVEGGGASFNIHYGLNPPDDTSMLWVETESEPTSMAVRASNPQHAIGDPSVEVRNDDITGFSSFCNCASVTYGSYVYFFGGYISGSYKNYICRFDMQNEVFVKLQATLTANIGSCTAALVGTKIYIFGGQTSSSYVDKIWVFDVATETIETLDETLPQIGVTDCEAVGSKIYLFGWFNSSGYKNTIYEFDTETEKITELSETMSISCASLGHTAHGTDIYLFGGYGDGVGAMSSISVFDTTTKTIRDAGVTLPAGSGGTPPINVGDKIYYFMSADGSIISYDIPSGGIDVLSVSLPSGGYGHGYGVLDGNIYLIGGRSGGTYLRTEVLFKAGRFVYTLAENNAFAKVSIQKNFFDLVSGDTSVNIGVAGVYIGNADGYGEQVTAKLYNGTKWEEI